jgi:hypothetical protein
MLKRVAASLCLLAAVHIAADADPAVRITVESTPGGAKVYVDGKDNGMACQSGPTCKPNLPRGRHRLILELDGYQSLEETINVSGPQRLTFTLKAAPAKLDIKTLATNTHARGGEIFIDGSLAGVLPALLDVTPGKHMIEVRRAGFLSYTEAVEVKNAEVRAVYVALTTEPTALSQTPSTATAKPDPPPPAIAPPVPAGPALEPVSVVPRSSGVAYVVATNGSQCTAPCTLHVPAGLTTLSVRGPADKAFTKQIEIPSGPSQITVQHFTKSKVIAGSILLGLGVPLLLGTSAYLLDLTHQQGSNNGLALLAGGALGAHGLAFTIAGIEQLATMRTNRIDVVSLGQRLSMADAPPSTLALSF